MPELRFRVEDAVTAERAATPTLNLMLGIEQVVPEGAQPAPIQSVSLQCQVRIEARNRIYKETEQERLTELFGQPGRWGRTLHSMLWTQVQVTVPSFERRCSVAMPVPCSFDFNVAATKYFHALEYGKAPLLLLFSGSVFYRDTGGGLAMDMISWDKEAKYRMPVAVWQQMMDRYYPDQAWLCLSRQVFAALHEYKRLHGHAGFDETLASLLPNVRRRAL